MNVRRTSRSFRSGIGEGFEERWRMEAATATGFAVSASQSDYVERKKSLTLRDEGGVAQRSFARRM